MNKVVIAILSVAICSTGMGQSVKQVPLKPIYMQSGKFYYGDKRVRNGYAIQIPLQSLNDEIVNRKYQTFSSLRSIKPVIGFIPLIYLLAISNSNYASQQQANTFAALLLGTVSINLIINVISNHQLRLGVDRYNSLILDHNPLGLMDLPPPMNQKLIGFSYSQRLGSLHKSKTNR